MVILTINNNYSSITGLDAVLERKLRNLLSYSPDAKSAYFSGGFRPKIPLIDKKGGFPTGLLLKVRSFVVDNKIKCTVVDKRVRPSANCADLRKGILPHKSHAGQEEARKRSAYFKQGTVVMPTGTGKSLAISYIIQNLAVRTLIVVPNLGLKKQFSDTIFEVFGHTPNVVVENIDSPNLKNLTDFDCLIIDEAHHSAAKTYRKLNKTAWGKMYYRFFFTATPSRNKEEEQILLQSLTGEVIYELKYQDAVSRDYIVPMEAYYIDLPKVGIKGSTWASVYKELVVDNQARNKLIAELMKGLQAAGVATLCLVKEINHGEKIQNLAKVPFASGEGKNASDLIDRFNSKALDSLIGTTGVLGEGVDTKPAEFIILAGLGKSQPALMQAFGRGFRNSPGKASCKIIIFRDSSHKWGLSHFKAQCKVLKEQYGVVPIRLDVQVDTVDL